MRYLTLGYIAAPRSVYRGIKKLPAASTLAGSESGWSLETYWRIESNPYPWQSMDEACEEFGPLFDDAVKIRLESEVPLGAFLSGGIDSSLVVASMAAQSDRVTTNTIAFQSPEVDESTIATSTAEHVGTEHNVYLANPDHADEQKADEARTTPTVSIRLPNGRC